MVATVAAFSRDNQEKDDPIARSQRDHHVRRPPSSAVVATSSVTPPLVVTPIPLTNPNFVADAVEKVLPSVVRIEVHVQTGDDRPPQRGSGSGFAVRAEDVLGTAATTTRNNNEVLILTNAHCVLTPHEFHQHGHHGDTTTERLSTRKTVYVEWSEDKQWTGTIVAADTKRDVALIRLHLESEDVPSAAVLQLQDETTTGPPSTVRYGEFVAALGAPLELENTVTVGIVSNPRRCCRHDTHKQWYIQTDNTCHVGNSGGPLINMEGKVIGITAKKVADGISYSIPIHQAVESLREAYFAEKNSQKHQAAATVSSIAPDAGEPSKTENDSSVQDDELREERLVDPPVYSLFPYSANSGVPVSIRHR
jgi:S1-C subfamily serine protease